MTRGPDLATARHNEADARWRFLQTAHALERRLKPVQLIEDAALGAGAHAADLARHASDTAKARPRTIGLIGSIALAFVTRRQLVRLIRRVRKRPGTPEPEGSDPGVN